MTRKEATRNIVLWIQNTNLKSDAISKHFGLPQKDYDKIREMAKEIRGWCPYEQL